MKRKAIVIESAEKLECIRCDKAYRGEDDWSIVEFPTSSCFQDLCCLRR